MDSEASYQKTLNYLFAKLPMFSRIGKAALKPNLDNTLKLCAVLDNPQKKFKAIHIAGTNGKGSVSHSLAAIFQDAGYKTGLYTSPHLIDFRERIRINGLVITKEWVVNFVENIKEAIETIEPSFFEITVAMAFCKFAEEKVDIAIVETGLGGRLDSTNIITPLLSIITNISYDHKDLLGNTLAEIAAEKAGIIKQEVPVVIGEQNAETERVFFEHSINKKSPLYYADSFWEMVKVNTSGDGCKPSEINSVYKAINKTDMRVYDLKTDLSGIYQQHNLKTVLTATELISYQGFDISVSKAITALNGVTSKTGLRGRWDRIQEKPIIIADVAHNPAGLVEVMKQWNAISADKKFIILGFVKDKDVREALSYFPAGCEYFFCNAQIQRALPAQELMELAASIGLHGTTYLSVKEAIIAAKKSMCAPDALLITGSFFVVGEAMEFLFQ